MATRQQLADELSGNLCRCTGYRPILDAGQRMFELPVKRLDTAPIVALLKSLRDDAPLHYAAVNPALPDAGSGAPRTDHFHAPRTLDALATALADRPQARLLAGCTDIGLWVNKQFRDLGDIVYLGEVDELKRIHVADGLLHIGAGATLEDALSVLAEHWPHAREAWLRFAGPPVRHAGTIGGNIANGSPIGDSAPVLMALGARVLLRRGAATREMALEDLYVDYMKNRIEPGEFVQALQLPLPAPAQRFRAYKITKRYDCDISALMAGLAIELDGDTVTAAPLRVRRHGRGGQARRRRRSGGARPALERGHGAGRGSRARHRFQPLDRPARQRRLSAPGGARIAAAFLARNPQPRCAGTGVDQRVGHGRSLSRGGPVHEQTRRTARSSHRTAPRRRPAAPSASSMRTNRRTCMSPAPPPTSTTCPNWPAPCTRRWACRRWRTGG